MWGERDCLAAFDACRKLGTVSSVPIFLQNSFDPAENRCGCPDPEGQAKNRQQGETGCAAKHAEAESQILEHIVHLDVATN